jgi:hypothetical protein
MMNSCHISKLLKRSRSNQSKKYKNFFQAKACVIPHFSALHSRQQRADALAPPQKEKRFCPDFAKSGITHAREKRGAEGKVNSPAVMKIIVQREQTIYALVINVEIKR